MHSYKWCAVPECTNTTLKTPNKLFVSVPKNIKVREKWLQLARRNPTDIAEKSVIFFCEDHFDMEKDMANYYKYSMGFAKQVKMVDGVLPSKFHCQQDRRKRTCEPDTSNPVIVKRPRINLTEECEDILPVAATVDEVHAENVENMPLESSQKCDKSTSMEPTITADKSVQCRIKSKVHFRSKGVQIKTQTKDIGISPFKWTTSASSTSPFKIIEGPIHGKLQKFGVIDPESNTQHLRISQKKGWRASETSNIAGKSSIKKKIAFDEEKSESDISLYTEAAKQHDSSFVVTSSSKLSDSATNVFDANDDVIKMQCLRNTMRLIIKKPKMYIGISEECYFIVHLIHKHTHIPHEHILLCLRKIRLNSTFSELEDNFGLSLSYGSKLFLKNIPLIANVLRAFIVKLDKYSIKKTLPVSFRHNYYNVSCIIDCLEIDIQKPSEALFQALTWSEYKKGNTVKYLISCTPNGLVNYISPGFGGRSSDLTIIENCDFLDTIESGSFILADRGFKNIEAILLQKGIKLLRPPSVVSGSKLSKAEVRQTKIIASLRIHVERVIRRLREFHMLKQHRVINTNFLRVIDDVIVIACALINLQDSLIK